MDVHAEILRAVDDYRDKVVGLSHEIHEHPEPKFEERFAADLLSGALAELGVEVERGIGGLETAFSAQCGKSGPTVAILAEYDALPNGHSCGHNLIAGAALAAFAALKSVEQHLSGRVMIIGTPAEEGGGGKITLLDKGVLSGVDAAMMVHPTDVEFRSMPALANTHVKLTFHGKAAHAAAAPWEGSSALSAVIQTFVSVDAARLHWHDGSRIHGIITNGGQAVNIIPHTAECLFLARARTSAYADEIAGRIVRCAEAAAAATGTTLSPEVTPGYKNMINNASIASRYAGHSESLGVAVPEPPPGTPSGSTDMGDVSHALPAIHPLFAISKRGEGNCHEDAFVELADQPRAYDAMIRVSKAMALTAYDLQAEPPLMEAAKAEFSARSES